MTRRTRVGTAQRAVTIGLVVALTGGGVASANWIKKAKKAARSAAKSSVDAVEKGGSSLAGAAKVRVFSAADAKRLSASVEKNFGNGAKALEGAYNKATADATAYLTDLAEDALIRGLEREYQNDKGQIEPTSKAFQALYATADGKAAMRRIGQKLSERTIDAAVMKDINWINDQIRARLAQAPHPAPRDRWALKGGALEPKVEAALDPGDVVLASSGCSVQYKLYGLQFDGTGAALVGGTFSIGVAWDPCHTGKVLGYVTLGGVGGLVAGGAVNISFQWSKASVDQIPGSGIGYAIGGSFGAGAVTAASWNHVGPGFGGSPVWALGPEAGFGAEAAFTGTYTWKM